MGNAESVSFSKHRLFYIIALVVLLVAGFFVRMIDLTDPPLDFHATRQLREAIIARRIYLQMKPDADSEHVAYATDPALYDYVARREPPITEGLVALIYLLIGSETLWVSRIVTSLFWCLGGYGLYLLVNRLASKDAALISLGFYLFSQFGVIASRSFQPEALMVAGMIWSLYCFVLWLDEHTWKNAILAGVVTGLTLLVKPNPLFILLPTYFILLIFTNGLRNTIKNIQVWGVAGLSGLFAIIYYLAVNPAAGGFLKNFWLDAVNIIPTSVFFLGWGSIVTDVTPFVVLLIAFASTLLYEKTGRLLSIGLWIGYVILGFFTPQHIYTHNYYSIVLVPITAIALGKVGQVVVEFASNKKLILKLGLILVAIIGMSYASWNVYKDLHEKDYRGEPAGWAQVGQALPKDQKIIALTHNYGENLAYYGYRMLPLWPNSGDLNLRTILGAYTTADFEDYYEERVKDFDLFLVTHFGELNSQPMLMDKLSQLPIYAEGPGYILYDLHP
ncbi:glycosyltransferase family 39 protein [bacterium]|nr:glycosyltransferase family 39 protein [bacterium]